MFTVFALAVALSMDAFAVAIGLGAKKLSQKRQLAFKAAFLFGIFQAFMPFLGYIGGVELKAYIGEYNLVIAFVLLFFIGGKMFYEALGTKEESEGLQNISNKLLLSLAIATSIDAMGAGFSLELLEVNIYLSLVIIGLTTFVLSALGIYIGHRGSRHFEQKAELFGGLVLLAIGCKFLFSFLGGF